MSLFRPTAHVSDSARKLGFLATLCIGLLGLFAVPALASSGHHRWSGSEGRWSGYEKPAPPKVNAELAVCPGQTFSQPFLEFGDENFYTEVEDSDFDAGSGGWALRNGAKLVDETDPDGSAGKSLELPGGAYAISPPVCVTLQYPTARAWTRTVAGGGGVTVSVFYAKAKYGLAAADDVGYLGSDGGWNLSDPFEVRPELAGDDEGAREVRFVFSNRTWSSVFDLSGLYVDPRMR